MRRSPPQERRPPASAPSALPRCSPSTGRTCSRRLKPRIGCVASAATSCTCSRCCCGRAAALAAVGGHARARDRDRGRDHRQRVFSFAQEFRAERAVEALSRVLPQRAQVRRDGRRQEIDAEALVPGDVMLLAPGDRISADATAALRRRAARRHVDADRRVAPGAPPPPGPGRERPRRAWTACSRGRTCSRARPRRSSTATGMATELGRIAHADAERGAPRRARSRSR